MPSRRLPAPPLELYRAKRNFAVTPEPSGDAAASHGSERAYVIQKHAATRLHYDLRLEHGGVMWSWAVPKGPSYDPADKRIALRTEDHPIAYNTFEGTIPKGHYGAGTVLVWDRGRWEPVGDPEKGLAEGKLLFTLHGLKLKGQWELVRIKPREGERGDPWILFKKRDAHARPAHSYDVVRALPDSVGPEPAPAPAAAPRRNARVRTAAGLPLPSAAVPAPLPATLAPQLATQASGLPTFGSWIFEIKFDGYRMLARCGEDGPRLFTRNGHDWSSKMPRLIEELAALQLKGTWLDGEVVVLGPDGMPDFVALQNAFDGKRTSDMRYFLFDVPFFEGHDLRAAPLVERRALLEAFVAQHGSDHLRFSSAFDADPVHLMHSAQQLKLEGLMAKRADAPYVSRRSDTWLKLKGRQRQEFVIGGFTDRGGDAGSSEIGSLLLGVFDDQGRLHSVGNVGTGWSGETARTLKTKLLALETKASPFEPLDPKAKRRWPKRAGVIDRWVRPQLVADVNFGDWTPDGVIRHATFIGLRDDKPARDVRRETDATPAGALPLARTATATQVKVTHPERVIDPRSGATKLDLVRYYESMAPWLLPHLKGRPCSLVRGPDGVGGELFFQKHLGRLQLKGVNVLDPALWPGHESLLEVGSAAGIAEAAQMNVIEFHTWNANVRHIDQPDRMVFDLDPGERVPWPRVQEAASLLHAFLGELGLKAWLKTSGGKGLHVVVPIAPQLGWDAVKGFSQAVVQRLADVAPDRFVAKSGPANRVGKIFVDYIRNSHGATTAAAFSVRARPGLGVSMPVDWSQLAELKSGAQWTLADAREHLSFQREDPWAAYWRCRQTLARAAKRLGYNTEAAA